MGKNFFIAWIVAFVVWMAGDFGVHGGWLAGQYMALASLYRPEAEQMQYMPWMLGAHVIMAGAVAWIYARGQTAAPWMGQGARFGIAAGLLTSAPYLTYYSVQPLPIELVMNQFVGNLVVMVLVGIATAFVYRNAKA